MRFWMPHRNAKDASSYVSCSRHKAPTQTCRTVLTSCAGAHCQMKGPNLKASRKNAWISLQSSFRPEGSMSQCGTHLEVDDATTLLLFCKNQWLNLIKQQETVYGFQKISNSAVLNRSLRSGLIVVAYEKWPYLFLGIHQLSTSTPI